MIGPAESSRSFNGSPAYRPAASRSAALSASRRMATAPVSAHGVISRSQSYRGPASSRAVMPPAAIASARTASADQVDGEGLRAAAFICRGPLVSMPLPLSCIRFWRCLFIPSQMRDRVPAASARCTAHIADLAYAHGVKARKREPQATLQVPALARAKIHAPGRIVGSAGPLNLLTARGSDSARLGVTHRPYLTPVLCVCYSKNARLNPEWHIDGYLRDIPRTAGCASASAEPGQSYQPASAYLNRILAPCFASQVSPRLLASVLVCVGLPGRPASLCPRLGK